MRLWHPTKANSVSQPHQRPAPDLRAIQGDHPGVGSQVTINGGVSRLRGCLNGLTGSCNDLAGEVTLLRGDISGITGLVDKRLVGDASGLRGDVSDVWGNASGLRGEVSELLEKGLLWPKNRPLSLEMFATRYKLAMEFFDNSGLPALIAFHAVQGPPLHWLTVRDNAANGFIVAPLLEIARRFPGQEITKVAVPGQANWHISQDLLALHTDRVYALEHIEPLVSSFTN
ncbi:MAG: hypothetical protein GWP14_06025 [Actinobacteria bacterium]|nr:hypothetical protein [Actinomycetota bacterium]